MCRRPQAWAAARQAAVKSQLSRLCFYDILYANGKRGNGGRGPCRGQLDIWKDSVQKPMMLTSGDSAEEVPLMRHVSSLDLSTGSGSFFGDVPVGTMANICLINKDDIVVVNVVSFRVDEKEQQFTVYVDRASLSV